MDKSLKDHWLIVVTDDYAGNFTRELGSYAFGVIDEYASEDEDWSVDTDNLASSEQTYSDFWTRAVEYFATEEYGMMPYEICNDPASNDNSYNSVKFKIYSDQWGKMNKSPDFVEFLKKRLAEACDRLKKENSDSKPNFVKLVSVTETRAQDIREF